MDAAELRENTRLLLGNSVAKAAACSAFLGFDGFVDEIIHVVDKRDTPSSFQRIPTISAYAERVANAAGKSTNFELVTQRVKLGGNGPILANALAQFGVGVTYVGSLGYPHPHPVFEGFARHARIHSIAEPGHSDALEFEDGKLILGKSAHLTEVNWKTISERFGKQRLVDTIVASDLVGFVNWTMLPYMSEIWESIQSEVVPLLDKRRRCLFFDLADPERRLPNDLSRALDLIVRFQKDFDVILGLNEKESVELGDVLGFHPKPRNPDGLAALARELLGRLPISCLVIHPVRYALAASPGTPVAVVQGPFIDKPKITTGAGDHFNAGFCLGKMLGADNATCVLLGVTTSGHYVRTALSPTINDLATMLQNWPAGPA